MRSQNPATTPRSWVISITAVSRPSVSSCIRSRIWAWVVTSSAVVGSSAISRSGLHDRRHGDHHPLAHAARQLVRIVGHPLLRVGDVDVVQALHGDVEGLALAHPLVEHDRLHQLVADGEHRVERGHRVLEDHGDLSAPDVAHLLLGEARAGRTSWNRIWPVTTSPAGPFDQPHHREGAHRLAAPRLPHHPELLALVDGEGHPVDGAHDALVSGEVGAQVLDLEEGFSHRRLLPLDRLGRIQGIPQAVAEKVHRQHGDDQRRRREHHQPPGARP